MRMRGRATHAGTCGGRTRASGRTRPSTSLTLYSLSLSLSLSALRGTLPGQDADFQEDETIYDALRLEELDQVMPAAAMPRMY